MKHYLNVNYSKKDQIKQLAVETGTKISWDQTEKLWYWWAEKGMELPDFLKPYQYIPKTTESKRNEIIVRLESKKEEVKSMKDGDELYYGRTFRDRNGRRERYIAEIVAHIEETREGNARFIDTIYHEINVPGVEFSDNWTL